MVYSYKLSSFPAIACFVRDFSRALHFSCALTTYSRFYVSADSIFHFIFCWCMHHREIKPIPSSLPATERLWRLVRFSYCMRFDIATSYTHFRSEQIQKRDTVELYIGSSYMVITQVLFDRLSSSAVLSECVCEFVWVCAFLCVVMRERFCVFDSPQIQLSSCLVGQNCLLIRSPKPWPGYSVIENEIVSYTLCITKGYICAFIILWLLYTHHITHIYPCTHTLAHSHANCLRST